MPENKRSTVLVVAPVPPPMHGAAYATQLLLNSGFCGEFDVLHIDARYVNKVSELSGFSAGKVFKMLAYLWKTCTTILTRRVDVVILEPAFYAGPFVKDAFFILLCRLLPVKSIAWFHMNFTAMGFDKLSGLQRWFIVRMLKMLDRGVCVGRKLIDGLPEQLDRRKLAFIHNGIPPLEQLHPETNKKDKSKVRVMYLSNMGRTKGWHVLLQAARQVRRVNNNVEFHFYGNPMADSPIEEIREEFAASGGGDAIVYHGPVYGPDKNDAFLAADIFCFPSMYPPEAFPLTILEAMNAGLSIVTTDVGAVAEALDGEQGGAVVPQNDPSALAAAILALADDPERRQNQGRYNRARFFEHFTSEAFARRWTEFVRGVVD